MRIFPCGFGGSRRDPEEVKHDGWHDHNILVVSPMDYRLTWPERELVRQLGEKLYGVRKAKVSGHG